MKTHSPKIAGDPSAFASRTALLALLVLVLPNWLPATHAASQSQDRTPAPRRIVVPRLNTQVRIDGKLDEKAWSSAARLGPFTKNDNGAKGRVRTEVKAWYDREALYLGWICEDPDIQSTFTKRDSHFWEEEVCEFFVTTGDLTRYYELQWNPLSAVFDAVIVNQLGADGLSRSFQGEWGYTAKGMAHAVQVDGTVGQSSDRDRSWVVEVRIPFWDFGQATPKPGDRWRANFYRFCRDTGQPVEGLAWSPTRSPSFHQPARFGYLEFGR